MNKDKVTHIGIVTAVSERHIVVRTEDIAKCDGCAVAALCNKGSESGADSSEVITVDTPDAASYQVGTRVKLQASSASTLSASWWSLILPTLLFIATLLAMNILLPSAGAWNIAAAFGALALYTLFLYLMRSRLAAAIHWSVERLT